MKLVCQGDSITYGYEVRRSAVWTRLFQNQTGIETLNRGENGITTAGMMHRFSFDVIAENPSAVLIMGGGNDILANLGTEEPEKNITEMIRRADKAGIRVLLGIPAPFCAPIREDWAAMADFPAMTPVYDAFAERLKSLAENLKADTVDFRSGVTRHVAGAGISLRELYLDGIHLNERGHGVFASILEDRFEELGVLP
jgi:lysophospholipase L1-like esterase